MFLISNIVSETFFEDFFSQYNDWNYDLYCRLPLPWLLYFIIFSLMGEPPTYISVTSKGMACSIGILFLMIILLIISIAVFRWKMNKVFGIVMLITYTIFCVVSVLLETNYIDCPMKMFLIEPKCPWWSFVQRKNLEPPPPSLLVSVFTETLISLQWREQILSPFYSFFIYS